MTIEGIVTVVLEFMKTHERWAVPVVFGLAFGESLAFISLLLPATVILLGFGVLIGQADIEFLPVCIAAALGAFLGDWISYLLGYHYKDRVGDIWPLSRQPELLIKGKAFFYRWGILGVFVGRFFGPLRAAVPLVAGICNMPQRYFQLANVGSALVWAVGILAPGAFGWSWFSHWFG